MLLFIALAIKLDSPGPVFFRQERVGRFGKPFHIHKFRTMRHDPAGKGMQLSRSAATAASPAWGECCVRPSSMNWRN